MQFIAGRSILLLLFLLPGTAWSQELDPRCIKHQDHSKLTFLLIDRTDELKDIQGFKETLIAVKEMIRPGERFVGGISTGKASEARVILDLVNPEHSIWESPLKIRSQEKLFKDCLTEMESKLLAQTEKHDSSAILETLGFVSKIISGDSAATKQLIMYSDMNQNSPQVSFYGLKNFAPDQWLAKVEKDGLISEFKGVPVYVAGVGASTTDQRTKELEGFWNKYFLRAGGELKFFGPILLGR